FVAHVDLALDTDRIVIAISEDLAAIGAVGYLSDGLAHRRFRSRLNEFAELSEISKFTFIEQLLQIAIGRVVRRHHGIEVAQHFFGHASIRADDFKKRLVRTSGSLDQHRRKTKTLLEYFASVPTEQRSADVGDVGDAANKADQTAKPKDRLHDAYIGEMTGAEPRVVRQHHIALMPCATWAPLQHGLSSEWQRSEERGNALI